MRYALLRHPDTPSAADLSVSVEVAMGKGGGARLTFRATPGDRLALPDPAPRVRADGLWRRTCFELFVRGAGEPGYVEFNLSPSGQWAAYAFDDYRHGQRDLAMAVEPHVETRRDAGAFVLAADVDLAGLPLGRRIAGLSAVIEERDGTRSYWALAHPDPEKPDFHHPGGFAIELPIAT